jgi:hypothetical protein
MKRNILELTIQVQFVIIMNQITGYHDEAHKSTSKRLEFQRHYVFHLKRCLHLRNLILHFVPPLISLSAKLRNFGEFLRTDYETV